MRVVVAAAVSLLASQANATTFFSVAGAPDFGKQSYETSLVSLDEGPSSGISETDVGDVGLFTGTSGRAAAPAGDSTQYEAIGPGGSATFNLSGFMSGSFQPIRSVSVYLGSIDPYNHIDILNSGGAIIRTISGADLPADSGDQGSGRTNRRAYINFDPSEGVSALRFRSDGVAFEFDDIAASSARFDVADGAALDTMPSAVPEPASWALLIGGVGMTGGMVRRRYSNSEQRFTKRARNFALS